MLHYQMVRTSPGGATLSNKMNNTVHYRQGRHTLALMCAKNHLLIFSSFLDIWENVEWPRFFWTTLYMRVGDTSWHEMELAFAGSLAGCLGLGQSLAQWPTSPQLWHGSTLRSCFLPEYHRYLPRPELRAPEFFVEDDFLAPDSSLSVAPDWAARAAMPLVSK